MNEQDARTEVKQKPSTQKQVGWSTHGMPILDQEFIIIDTKTIDKNTIRKIVRSIGVDTVTGSILYFPNKNARLPPLPRMPDTSYMNARDAADAMEKYMVETDVCAIYEPLGRRPIILGQFDHVPRKGGLFYPLAPNEYMNLQSAMFEGLNKTAELYQQWVNDADKEVARKGEEIARSV